MQDATEEQITPRTPSEETPGDRWQREQWERATSRKASALAVLGPLGFEDLEDNECPGAIWHRSSGITLDAAQIAPGDVVDEMVRIGVMRGKSELRLNLRQLLGV